MKNFTVESELSPLKCDTVIMMGAAIVGVLLINTFFLFEISNHLYIIRKEKKRVHKKEKAGLEKVFEKQIINDKPTMNDEQAINENNTANEKR